MGLRLPCLGNPGTKVQRCKQLEESFCARLVPHRHLAATEVEVEPTNRRAFECHADEALLRRAIHLWHIQNGFFQGVTRGSGYCAYWKPCSGDRHKPSLQRGPEIGRLATTGPSIGTFLSLGLACQHRRDGRWSEPGVHQGRHPASRHRDRLGNLRDAHGGCLAGTPSRTRLPARARRSPEAWCSSASAPSSCTST